MRDDHSRLDGHRRGDDGNSAVGFLVGVALTVAVLVLVPGARERLPGEVDLAGQGSSFDADDLPKLYDEVYDGVARFEVETCDRRQTGSGALVADSLVLTAAHVVMGSATIKIPAAGQSAVGTVVGLSPDDGLALVRTDLPLPGHVVLRRPVVAGRDRVRACRAAALPAASFVEARPWATRVEHRPGTGEERRAVRTALVGQRPDGLSVARAVLAHASFGPQPLDPAPACRRTRRTCRWARAA